MPQPGLEPETSRTANAGSSHSATEVPDERIDEGVLRWFGHVERMERDRIAKTVYVGVCAGSHSVCRPRKRWIDTVKVCLRKRGLDVRQARRMVQDGIELLLLFGQYLAAGSNPGAILLWKTKSH